MNEDKNIIENPNAKSSVDCKVRLPPKENAIVIIFDDGIKNTRIETTPYMWDILKALDDDQALLFTKKDNKTGYTLTITVEMEKAT